MIRMRISWKYWLIFWNSDYRICKEKRKCNFCKIKKKRTIMIWIPLDVEWIGLQMNNFLLWISNYIEKKCTVKTQKWAKNIFWHFCSNCRTRFSKKKNSILQYILIPMILASVIYVKNERDLRIRRYPFKISFSFTISFSVRKSRGFFSGTKIDYFQSFHKCAIVLIRKTVVKDTQVSKKFLSIISLKRKFAPNVLQH